MSTPIILVESTSKFSQTLRAIVKLAALVSSSSIEKKLLVLFGDDSISVQGSSKFGQCQCGRCIIGERPMSIRMEELHEEYRDNLKYIPEGLLRDFGPYFQARY